MSHRIKTVKSLITQTLACPESPCHWGCVRLGMWEREHCEHSLPLNTKKTTIS